MGKQTGFFMSESDEAEFLGLVGDHGDVILGLDARELTVEEALHYARRKVFIALPQSEPTLSAFGLISSAAEVVEFWRCLRRGDGHIEDGRIWAEFRDYDSSGRLVPRAKQFQDMYSFYAKWIKKHYRISSNKRYYIGPEAYRKYKEDGWTMRSGVVTVEFE